MFLNQDVFWQLLWLFNLVVLLYFPWTAAVCYQHLGSWVPQDRNGEETPETFTDFIKFALKHKGGSTEERKALQTDSGASFAWPLLSAVDKQALEKVGF